MATIEELVVAAKPEGLDETTAGLEGVEDQLDDSTAAMEDSSDQFGDLAQKWEGALGAIVGGVAVAVGGLLTQVPVLGELGAALGGTLSAIGFQIDQLLRSLGAGGLTDAIFKFNEALFNADGAAGDLVGAIGGIVAVISGAIAGYLSWIAATQGIIAAGSALVGGLGTVASVIGTVISAIAGLISLPAVVIAAIVALAAAFIFNVGGIRDKTIKFIGDILDFFGKLASKGVEFAKELWSGLKEYLSNLGTEGVAFIKSLWEDGKEWLQKLVDEGKDLAGDLYDGFISALTGLGQAIAGIFLDAINGVIDILNKGLDQVPDAVKSQVGFSSLDEVSLSDVGLSGGDNTGNNGFRATRTGTPQISLDGRLLNDQQGRYRGDETSRRGRGG